MIGRGQDRQALRQALDHLRLLFLLGRLADRAVRRGCTGRHALIGPLDCAIWTGRVSGAGMVMAACCTIGWPLAGRGIGVGMGAEVAVTISVWRILASSWRWLSITADCLAMASCWFFSSFSCEFEPALLGLELGRDGLELLVHAILRGGRRRPAKGRRPDKAIALSPQQRSAMPGAVSCSARMAAWKPPNHPQLMITIEVILTKSRACERVPKVDSGTAPPDWRALMAQAGRGHDFSGQLRREGVLRQLLL